MGMVQYGMRMRGMEYVPRHLRRSEMSEKKVNNSKYMNELIIVKCVYTSEETGGGRRSEPKGNAPLHMYQRPHCDAGISMNSECEKKDYERQIRSMVESCENREGGYDIKC